MTSVVNFVVNLYKNVGEHLQLMFFHGLARHVVVLDINLWKLLLAIRSEPAHYSGRSAVLLYIIAEKILDLVNVRMGACAVCFDF